MEISNCPTWPAAIVAVVWLIHLVFEYWIGKTEKVKSASVLELVITVMAMGAMYFLRRDKNGSN